MKSNYTLSFRGGGRKLHPNAPHYTNVTYVCDISLRKYPNTRLFSFPMYQEGFGNPQTPEKATRCFAALELRDMLEDKLKEFDKYCV